jgi:hypothetical protein
LVLKEDSTGITAVANSDGQDFKSESDAVTKVQQAGRQPGVTQVKLAKNDLPVAAHKSQDPTLQDTNTEVNMSNLTPSMLSKLGADGQGDVTVNVKENKNPRKLSEMRMNSVPFTKRELSSLLKGK